MILVLSASLDQRNIAALAVDGVADGYAAVDDKQDTVRGGRSRVCEVVQEPLVDSLVLGRAVRDRQR